MPDFHALGEQAAAVAQDLLARDEINILVREDEGEGVISPGPFLDALCEASSEHIDPPEDRTLDSFSLLVGAAFAAFVAARTFEREA